MASRNPKKLAELNRVLTHAGVSGLRLVSLADVAPYARGHAILEALDRRPDLLARHRALDLAEDLLHRVRRWLAGGDPPHLPSSTVLFFAG